TITSEGVVDLDEDFLGQVEGRFVVADHAVNVGRDRALVTADEFFEAAVEALDGDGHEFAVADRAQISRKHWGNGGGRSVHYTGVLRSTIRVCFMGVSHQRVTKATSQSRARSSLCFLCLSRPFTRKASPVRRVRRWNRT